MVARTEKDARESTVETRISTVDFFVCGDLLFLPGLCVECVESFSVLLFLLVFGAVEHL